MNDDFRALNRRNRRKWDQWYYRLQWLVGTLAGIAILVTIFAQAWMKAHK